MQQIPRRLEKVAGIRAGQAARRIEPGVEPAVECAAVDDRTRIRGDAVDAVRTGRQQHRSRAPGEHSRGSEPPAAVLRARRFAITAAECATAIRRGLERDARTVVTPRGAWLLVALSRLFPAAMEARMAAMNET